MFHPLLSAAIRRPDLVLDHLGGYAALVQQETSALAVELARRAIAAVVAAMALLVFLITAGVAVMLGVMLDDFRWVLLAVPGAAFLLSVLAWTVARQRWPVAAFGELRTQIDADREALRAAVA
jgi:hypothetical protein